VAKRLRHAADWQSNPADVIEKKKLFPSRLIRQVTPRFDETAAVDIQ
jgi:hypothetical protein